MSLKLLIYKILHLEKKKNPWREAHRFVLELSKKNDLTDDHFHEASVYSYATIVLTSFYY